MIKVKITSILKKGTRFFANILDRGSAFNNIPFIQPGGFVKRYKESETQFGWVVEKEGRRYVVAVEGQDFPDLKEDELVIYLNKDHYIKLSKDETCIYRGEDNYIKLSDKETAVYHDKSNYMKFDGSKMIIEATDGYLANELYKLLSELVKQLLIVQIPTALGPATLTNITAKSGDFLKALSDMLGKYKAKDK